MRADGGAVLASLSRAAGRPRADADRAARRQGGADAVPARHLRRARPPADAGDGQDEALPGPDHRGARADGRRGVLDAQRLPPADRAQGAGRQDGAGAAGARARGRLPDPGAQHREGAQPAREGDRRAAHVRRPGADLRTADEESSTRSSSRSRRWRRWASPTRSGGGSRAARTTRSCARSTSGCRASSPRRSPARRERAGAAARLRRGGRPRRSRR